MVELALAEGATLLEVHLAPKDLFEDRPRVLETFRPLRDRLALVVHAPEFVHPPGVPQPILVNLASPVTATRLAAVRMVEATTDLARELGAEAVVIHPGGATRPGEAPQGSLPALRLSLRTLDLRAPCYLENMPAHYHFRDAGEGTSALGRFPGDFEGLGGFVDGFCLDVCHAALARPEGSPQVAEAFADLLGHQIRHVHVSGARVPAGEGIPPGAPGDVLTPRVLKRVAALVHPEAAWVPEVWAGEADAGKGFRFALRYLREHLPEVFP